MYPLLSYFSTTSYQDDCYRGENSVVMFKVIVVSASCQEDKKGFDAPSAFTTSLDRTSHAGVGETALWLGLETAS